MYFPKCFSPKEQWNRFASVEFGISDPPSPSEMNWIVLFGHGNGIQWKRRSTEPQTVQGKHSSKNEIHKFKDFPDLVLHNQAVGNGLESSPYFWPNLCLFDQIPYFAKAETLQNTSKTLENLDTKGQKVRIYFGTGKKEHECRCKGSKKLAKKRFSRVTALPRCLSKVVFNSSP